MSRKQVNPPPFGEGLRGVLNALHKSACTLRREFIRSMNPPPPPAGPGHDADPAHVCAFFLAFFPVAVRTAFFMNFGSLLGPENQQKSHPGRKKCVPGAHFLRMLVRTVFFVFFGGFGGKKNMKNQCLFGACFGCGAFFFQPGDP